jgi:UDP-2,4-diacetamido-2,4,6-trideoxy-beta-L-altropyranose hydrolase
MKIAIKANGGQGIGMGHIMRTLVLAKELSKYHKVFYICESKPEYFSGINMIMDEGFEVIDDLNREADMIIVDSYNVDYRYFQQLKKQYEYVVYIDDLNLFFHPVDLVINQNINAEDLNYIEEKVLLGTKYLLLREEFRNMPRKQINKNISEVLITMGGADPLEATMKIMQQLKDVSWQLHIVIGPAFHYKEKLYLFKSENVTFYESANMKILMEKCDLAISSCGSTLYELSACGTPTIGIGIAENQLKVAEKFEEMGMIKYLGYINTIDWKTLSEELNSLATNIEMRKTMSMKTQELVDGLGSKRVVDYINDNFLQRKG